MSSKNTVSADNQQATSGEISNEYLAGFIDGEGCFYVGFSKRMDLPLGWQVITEFHISQNPGGKNILEAFCARIGAGYIKPNHPKNPRDRTWVLIVKDRTQIKESLLPFFEKHPLHSERKQQFYVFKRVFSIIEEKRHLNIDGFEEIVNLVFSIPVRGKKRYSREILLTGASETIRQNSLRMSE